jgi:hypothetical protein
MLYRQHGSSVSSNSFRRAADIEERIQVLDVFRKQAYLSSIDYRRKIRGVINQLSRRALVRAVRGDLKGMGHHARVLAGTLAQYVLRSG